jgi:hypothetical protein
VRHRWGPRQRLATPGLWITPQKLWVSHSPCGQCPRNERFRRKRVQKRPTIYGGHRILLARYGCQRYPQGAQSIGPVPLHIWTGTTPDPLILISGAQRRHISTSAKSSAVSTPSTAPTTMTEFTFIMREREVFYLAGNCARAPQSRGQSDYSRPDTNWLLSRTRPAPILTHRKFVLN